MPIYILLWHMHILSQSNVKRHLSIKQTNKLHRLRKNYIMKFKISFLSSSFQKKKTQPPQSELQSFQNAHCFI